MKHDGTMQLWQEKIHRPKMRIILLASRKKIFRRLPHACGRDRWIAFNDDLIFGEKFAIIVGNRVVMIKTVFVVVQKTLSLTELVDCEQKYEDCARSDNLITNNLIEDLLSSANVTVVVVN